VPKKYNIRVSKKIIILAFLQKEYIRVCAKIFIIFSVHIKKIRVYTKKKRNFN
jgi:hypothetical protein